MSETHAPRAFISHAGEDKAEFAEPLARKLRENGIDAWLDKWEIKPGESLVERIFHEAMSTTDAVIVVLSRTSVVKPWVAKELDIAVVRNIQKLSRLIPIRLDDCDVPESLRDQLWIDWSREGGVNGVARKVVEVLFDHDPRPAVGAAPKYLEAVEFQVPGLTHKDTIVLQCLFEVALTGHREIMQTAEIAELAEKKGLTEEELNESSEVLLDHGYLWDKGSNLHHGYFIAEFPSSIFLEIAKANGHPIESVQRQMGSLIVNRGIGELDQLMAETGQPRGIVEAILDDWGHQGLVKTYSTMGGTQGIMDTSVQLKRWLAGSIR
jgi:hypothetical protein